MSVEFAWSDEQLAYRDAVVSFARERLGKDLRARDSAQEFPREDWDECARFGLQGLPVPVAYGGEGADARTMMLAMEALGYGCADNGLVFSLNAHLWSAVTPIVTFGSDEQKQRYLPGMCDGTIIGVQAMTEPESGSDAFSMSTSAVADGDHWLLNGSKTYITNAPVADVFVVFASTDRDRGWAGTTAFVVDAGTSGLTVGPAFDKMGLRTSPMSELSFVDCRIPRSAVLGSPGSGMSVFTESMNWERSCILASAVGVMQRQLEACTAYARTRRQFGKPIGSFQAVSHRIVEMRVRLEAGRALLYRLGWLLDSGQAKPADAALVKLFLSEAWVASSLDAVQLHGAYGYMTEAGIERDVRDALASRIYSGTSEMQRNIIARDLRL